MSSIASDKLVKCACESCHCMVQPGKGVLRDGKLYCSATCAYDCTKTTCVCVHKGWFGFDGSLDMEAVTKRS